MNIHVLDRFDEIYYDLRLTHEVQYQRAGEKEA